MYIQVCVYTEILERSDPRFLSRMNLCPFPAGLQGCRQEDHRAAGHPRDRGVHRGAQAPPRGHRPGEGQRLR